MKYEKMLVDESVSTRSPFELGRIAKKNPYGTWFDNPYPVHTRECREWFAGWDSIK